MLYPALSRIFPESGALNLCLTSPLGREPIEFWGCLKMRRYWFARGGSPWATPIAQVHRQNGGITILKAFVFDFYVLIEESILKVLCFLRMLVCTGKERNCMILTLYLSMVFSSGQEMSVL